MNSGYARHVKKVCCGRRKKRKEGGRERETEATWGPVNRLVLNSNNVGNRKHFSQSKRKPQSLGCLRAVAAGLCSPGLMGGRWAGWHHRATGSRAGAETQTNTASPAQFWSRAGWTVWTTSRPCVDKNFRGLLLGCRATGMHLIGNIRVCVCISNARSAKKHMKECEKFKKKYRDLNDF